MRFLLCKECGKIYTIPEVAWDTALPRELVEFSEDPGREQELCNFSHTCETLASFHDFIVRGAVEDPFKILVYVAIIKTGEMIFIIKSRWSLAEPPRYTVIPFIAVPTSLLAA